MSVTINGSTGITTPGISNSEGYTGDGLTIAAGAPSGAMTLDASGNLIAGATSSTYSAANRVCIEVNGTTDSVFAVRTGGTARAYLQGTSTQVNLYTSSAIPLTLGTDNNERMRIDSSGNLLVGTTSAVAKFVSSSGSAVQYAGHFRNDNPGTNYFLSFNYAGSEIGAIRGTNTATVYSTSSDYRLKENIQPMTGALAKVQALKPCTYKWKTDGSDGEGFIAHELAEVVPQCVTGEKDAVDAEGKPVYQGIDTSFLVATLTAAIQELKAQVDAQAVEIAALKGQA